MSGISKTAQYANVKQTLEQLGDWSYDCVEGEYYVHLDKAKVKDLVPAFYHLKGSFLPEKKIPIGDQMLFSLYAILGTQFEKPALNNEARNLYFKILPKELCLQNVKHPIQDYLCSLQTKYGSSEEIYQTCESEMDKMLRCLKLTQSQHADYIYKLLKINFAGLIHNIMIGDLKQGKEMHGVKIPQTLFTDAEWSGWLSAPDREKQIYSSILIFTGEQSIGKSRFVEEYLPPELSGLTAELHNHIIESPDLQKYEKREKIKGKLILHASDLEAEYMIKNKNLFKDVLAVPKYGYRYLYTEHMEYLYRRFIYIGSSNWTKVIYNDDGARRIIPVALNGIDKREINSIDKEKVFWFSYLYWTRHKQWIVDWYNTDDHKKMHTTISQMHLGWGGRVVREKTISFLRPYDHVNIEREIREDIDSQKEDKTDDIVLMQSHFDFHFPERRKNEDRLRQNIDTIFKNTKSDVQAIAFFCIYRYPYIAVNCSKMRLLIGYDMQDSDLIHHFRYSGVLVLKSKKGIENDMGFVEHYFVFESNKQLMHNLSCAFKKQHLCDTLCQNVHDYKTLLKRVEFKKNLFFDVRTKAIKRFQVQHSARAFDIDRVFLMNADLTTEEDLKIGSSVLRQEKYLKDESV